MSNYTARLDDWRVLNEFGDVRIEGVISGDGKRRFADGERVTTSSIDVENISEGDIVATRTGNHYYLGRQRAEARW